MHSLTPLTRSGKSCAFKLLFRRVLAVSLFRVPIASSDHLHAYPTRSRRSCALASLSCCRSHRVRSPSSGTLLRLPSCCCRADRLLHSAHILVCWNRDQPLHVSSPSSSTPLALIPGSTPSASNGLTSFGSSLGPLSSLHDLSRVSFGPWGTVAHQIDTAMMS